MIKFIYAVAIVICFASAAYAIRCHVCFTAKQHDCDDPFKAGNTYATDCDALDNTSTSNPDLDTKKATGCLKMKFEANGNEFANRVCFWNDIANSTKICSRSKLLLQSISNQVACEVCTTDLCNSSTSTGILAATALFLAVLVRTLS